MEKTKLVSACAAAMLAALILIFASSNITAAGTGLRRTIDSSQTGANRLLPMHTAPSVRQDGKEDALIQEFKPVTLDDLQPEGAVADAPVDFNGDGRTDFVVVRNTGGGPSGQLTWFYLPNGGGVSGSVNFGSNSDWILSEDFDGDNKDDITIWRPGAAGVAAFYILQSSNFTVRLIQFGQNGDIPSIIADYDGDGKADPAVVRFGTSAVWWYQGSFNNPGGNLSAVTWGTPTDVPAPGDWDGDGKTDFGIYRNTGTGQLDFWRLLSNGTVLPVTRFGTPADVYVPGDYDGDHKTDIAIAGPAAGQVRWQWISSLNGSVNVTAWGTGNDYPVQGQYDTDGKTDIAIWRRGTNPGDAAFWVQLSSTGGTFVQQWGLSGDFPAAAYNVF